MTRQDGIEFVGDPTGPPPPAEDVLDVGRRSSRSVPRVAVLVAVLALVAAGVAWLLTGGSAPSRPHAAATRSTAGGPSPLPSTQTVVPDVPTFRELSGTACAGPGVCIVSSTVPRALRAAVSHFLPESERMSVASATREAATEGDALLVGRAVETHVGAGTLFIRVRTYSGPATTPVPAITPTPPGLSSAFVHLETAAYSVDMQWSASGDTLVPFPQLRALARDPRLEALP